MRDRGSQADLSALAKATQEGVRTARESISKLSPPPARAEEEEAEEENSPFASIVAACLRNGADANAPLPSSGVSAALTAADAGARGLLKTLLDAGADATAVDPEASGGPLPPPQSPSCERESCHTKSCPPPP